MRFLALDSGLERTGYAVVEDDNGIPRLIKYGCVETLRGTDVSLRLLSLSTEMTKILQSYAPELVVMEQLFFNLNKKTAISVAQAQGSIMLLAAQNNLPVEFITPLAIKQSVTGYGRADKKQVQKMVGLLLHMDKLPQPDDVVDAIACGIAYCSMSKMRSYC
jgi:crossover junction endodeoxyribonuclease RuvC